MSERLFMVSWPDCAVVRCITSELNHMLPPWGPEDERNEGQLVPVHYIWGINFTFH